MSACALCMPSTCDFMQHLIAMIFTAKWMVGMTRAHLKSIATDIQLFKLRAACNSSCELNKAVG